MRYQHPPAHPPADPVALLRLLLQHNFVFVSATARRQALDDVGRFRESLTASEDYELWLRLLAAGFGAARVEGNLAVYRRRVGSNSRDVPRMLRSMRDVYVLVDEEWDVDADTRAVARRRRQHLDRLVGRHDPNRRIPHPRLLLTDVRMRMVAERRWLDVQPEPVARVLAAVADASRRAREGGSPAA